MALPSQTVDELMGLLAAHVHATSPGAAAPPPPPAASSGRRRRPRKQPAQRPPTAPQPADYPALVQEAQALRARVAELQAWKERALETMTKLAPQREKVHRKYAKAVAERRRLQSLERSLPERHALTREVNALRHENAACYAEINRLQDRSAGLEQAAKAADARAQAARRQCATVERVFLSHIERLAGARLRFESADFGNDAGPTDAEVEATIKAQVVDAQSRQGYSREAALAAVAQDTATWLEHRVREQTVDREKFVASQRERFESLEAAVRRGQSEKQDLRRQTATVEERLAAAERRAAGLEAELDAARADFGRARNIAAEERELAASSVKELNAYVRLVRTALIKQIGFVPRILERLDQEHPEWS